MTEDPHKDEERDDNYLVGKPNPGEQPNHAEHYTVSYLLLATTFTGM